MQNAEESFYRLPSKVRMKFDNDPLDFIDFASNPDNLDEMRELGLAKEVANTQATPAATHEAEAE
jgi:phage internal scaffolding protein